MFDHQQQEQFAAIEPTQPPDDIALALPQLIADVISGQRLQTFPVEKVHPRRIDNALKQRTHDSGITEQQAVAGVVFIHASALNKNVEDACTLKRRGQASELW